MAKVNYTGNLGEYTLYDDFYGMAYLGHDKGTAIYASNASRHIEISGSLKYDEDGSIDGGKVNAVTFYDDRTDSICAKVTGLSFNAVQLDAFLRANQTHHFVEKIFSRNDTINGSKLDDGSLDGYNGSDRINGKAGNDVINGNGGNDRMTGGVGSDLFVFQDLSGRDAITDFDAKGGGLDQDYIQADVDDIRMIVKSGHDAIIKFVGGDQVTLLDVRPADITPDDFRTAL